MKSSAGGAMSNSDSLTVSDESQVDVGAVFWTSSLFPLEFFCHHALQCYTHNTRSRLV
jgi:hypothetical protein